MRKFCDESIEGVAGVGDPGCGQWAAVAKVDRQHRFALSVVVVELSIHHHSIGRV